MTVSVIEDFKCDGGHGSVIENAQFKPYLGRPFVCLPDQSRDSKHLYRLSQIVAAAQNAPNLHSVIFYSLMLMIAKNFLLGLSFFFARPVSARLDNS